MNNIKQRRLGLPLDSHPDLHVGDCVPFTFAHVHRRNNELAYEDGQEPIIHLDTDLNAVASWANANKMKWAFTLFNAGAYYFEDRND